MVAVSAECKHCKTTDTIRVDDGDYDRWVNREGLVQQVFPDLKHAHREILIGARGGYYICDRCWDIVFAEGDEDEVDPPTWDKPEPPWKDEPSTDKRVQDEE
jgi:hypothetical protein